MICRKAVTTGLIVVLATNAFGAPHTNSATQGSVFIPSKGAIVTFEGGDGRSLETAVIIRNAASAQQGVAAETTWMNRSYSNWRQLRQALIHKNDRSYDQVTYVLSDGSKVTIWFDITDFYGKTTYTPVSELKRLPHSSEDIEAMASLRDYTVGDEDVYAIAVKFNVSPTLIREVNNLETIDLLRGQVIKVPTYKNKTRSWWKFW